MRPRSCMAPSTTAVLLFRERTISADRAIIAIRVWEVPHPVAPSRHRLKYSLFYGYPGRRLVGYDNERGKGDHRHYGEQEQDYVFVSIEQLLTDFRNDIAALRGESV